MTVNIQDLNSTWIKAGQTVSDLQNKAVLMAEDANATVEDVEKIQDDLANAKAKRDLAYENYLNAKADDVLNTDLVENPLTKAENETKMTFIDQFKGMMKNDPKVLNLVTSSTDENGDQIGLTIPQDIQTSIHALIRQYDSLEQYVNVEKVTTQTGSRVFEKMSEITALKVLDDENATIGDNDDPKLSLIKYAIKRYAGITTATNSLLKDTAENILAWLSGWIAKKVVVTRNAAIIEKMNAAPTKPTITNFDGIKDLVLNTVDPAIQSTSMILTNQSGFTALSKVKDALGQYLIQPSVTNPEIKQIEGKNIVVIADRWLPNTAKDTMPLYFGDLKQAVTLFDRENMSLLSTNIGAGAFEKDQTKVRVIDRFDVVSTDTEAFVAGSFKTIADQVASVAPATTATV